MRNGQATPIPLGGNLSRSMMINSRPALPIPSDDFYDTMEITDPTTMQVELADRGEPMQKHCMDQEDMKTSS